MNSNNSGLCLLFILQSTITTSLFSSQSELLGIAPIYQKGCLISIDETSAFDQNGPFFITSSGEMKTSWEGFHVDPRVGVDASDLSVDYQSKVTVLNPVRDVAPSCFVRVYHGGKIAAYIEVPKDGFILTKAKEAAANYFTNKGLEKPCLRKYDLGLQDFILFAPKLRDDWSAADLVKEEFVLFLSSNLDQFKDLHTSYVQFLKLSPENQEKARKMLKVEIRERVRKIIEAETN